MTRPADVLSVGRIRKVIASYRVRPRARCGPRLRKEFENGEEFYDKARSHEPIVLPQRRIDRPSREFLDD